MWFDIWITGFVLVMFLFLTDETAKGGGIGWVPVAAVWPLWIWLVGAMWVMGKLEVVLRKK